MGLTFITVLSKVASGALILPISEAIGQLKWSWFSGKDSKDAFDFEIFDKASRGAWGSFLLLVRTKGRSLAALGASLTVLLLAIDTFFQQVTDLPERWTTYGHGQIPQVVRYEPQYAKDYISGFELAQTNIEILTIAEQFFTSNGTQPVAYGNGSRPDIPLSCPTIKCTWPAYETLGMCSQCAEVPYLLTFGCIDTRVDWTSKLTSNISSYPNATVCGYWLNRTTDDPTLMSGYMLNADGEPEGETLIMRTLPLISNPLRQMLWGGSINFKKVRNPISDVLISSTLGVSQVHANEAPTLHECVVKWCVKTMESKYWSGTYEEKVTHVFDNDTTQGSPWTTFIYDNGDTDQSYWENVTINAPSTGANFSEHGWGVSNNTMVNTVFVFDRLFPAFTTVADNDTESLLRWRLGHSKDVRTRTLDINPWLSPNNISYHMERLTTALTNKVRASRSSELVAGTAYNLETYVAVHWAWLTFPLVMLALSVIFLVATIIKTSKGGNAEVAIWKTSAMPTLLYCLPEDARPTLTNDSTWRPTSSNGLKKLNVRLMPNKGWRVSGMSTSPIRVRRTVDQAPPGWI
jgi:hypothetical protein